jgi:hypothetical protein
MREMKYLLLLSVVLFLGCGADNGTTLIPNNMSPEEIQAEIEANQAAEGPLNSGGGV